jgi:hypothetical protein
VFKKGKMLNMDEMLPVLNYSEKMKYKNPHPNFLLKGGLYIIVVEVTDAEGKVDPPLLRPLFKNKSGQLFPLYLTLSDMAYKSISFI